MYLLIIIRHTLVPNLNINKIFVLRSFRSLSLNEIWLNQNPTTHALLVLSNTYSNRKLYRQLMQYI
jgi:hypothetical protein